MAARLERHVSRGTARTLARRAYRNGLGVRFARAFMPAFTDDFLVARQHRAHARVRLRAVQTALRELERAAHCGFIERTEFHLRSLPDFFGGSSPGNNESWSSLGNLPRRCRRRSTSSRNASTSWKCRYTEA